MNTMIAGQHARRSSVLQPPASDVQPSAWCECGKPLYRQCCLCGESELTHDAACSGPEWCRRMPALCGVCLEVEERRYDG